MPRTIAFTKGHGTGNDFVVVADPEGTLDLTSDQVAALCDRRFGIGADGLLRVVRSSALADGASAAADGAEWFMDYRNADGSIAEMCGNGTRVFAKYLVDNALATIDDGLRIGTRAGVKTLTRSDRGYEVDLGTWTIDAADVLVRARGIGVARPGIGIDVGNPHVVVALSSDEELDGLDLTYQPVLDPIPPAGANVEFVIPAAVRAAHEPGLVNEGVGRLRMRVFERGVGETLSCGTGVAATALAVRHWAGPAAPDQWIVDVSGGTLGVRIADVEGAAHVFLSGPAALVFSGEVALA